MKQPLRWTLSKTDVHVSNRPSLRSVSWNVKLSKVSCVSFIKKKRFENKRRLRTFCVTKPKKGNSTHHQLLKDPLSAMYLWISVLYKVNSKNDLECIIHTWIFKKGRILFFYHRSIGYTILMKALKVSFPSIDEWWYLEFRYTYKFRNRMAGFFSSFKKRNRIQTSQLTNSDLMLYT